MLYCGGDVPKDVNAATATIKAKRSSMEEGEFSEACDMAALQKDYKVVWILLERQRKKQRNTNYHSFEPYSMPYSELQH